MVDIAYKYVGIDKEFCNLKFFIWYEFKGNVFKMKLYMIILWKQFIIMVRQNRKCQSGQTK